MTFEEKKELMDKYEREFKRHHYDVDIYKTEFILDACPEFGIEVTDANGKPYIYIADRSEIKGFAFDPIKYLAHRGFTVSRKKDEPPFIDGTVEAVGVSIAYNFKS